MSGPYEHAIIGDERSIAKALEATVLEICNLINTRDFDLRPDDDSCGWTNFSKDFVYCPEYQAVLAQDLGEAINAAEQKGRENLIELFRQMTIVHPEYRLIPIDYSTQVHEKAAWAESYVTMETTGIPAGVIRQSVGVFEFKRDKAKRWWITRYHGMAGMAGD